MRELGRSRLVKPPQVRVPCPIVSFQPPPNWRAKSCTRPKKERKLSWPTGRSGDALCFDLSSPGDLFGASQASWWSMVAAGRMGVQNPVCNEFVVILGPCFEGILSTEVFCLVRLLVAPMSGSKIRTPANLKNRFAYREHCKTKSQKSSVFSVSV